MKHGTLALWQSLAIWSLSGDFPLIIYRVPHVDGHGTRVIAVWSGDLISPLFNAAGVIKERQRRLIIPFTIIVKTYPDNDVVIVKLYHFVEGETGQLEAVSFSFHWFFHLVSEKFLGVALGNESG
jgi:hypothetical protein